MRKDKEADREYQKRYYEEHIKNNPEAREKKNARQREYAKSIGRTANSKYLKEKTKSLGVCFMHNTEMDLLEWLNQQPNKAGYIKNLIREDMNKQI